VCRVLLEDLRAAFWEQPVTVFVMAGLEEISSHHRTELNRLARDENRWVIWLETRCAACAHPAIVGTSEHMLIVCRKMQPVGQVARARSGNPLTHQKSPPPR